jgi:uncharacterized membrane protein
MKSKFSLKQRHILGGMVTLFGGTGVYASVSLLLSKLEKLANPEFVPSCSINAWFDCGRVMDTKWGELLGYPNYINGIGLYSLAVMTGLFIIFNRENDRRVMWFALVLAGLGLVVNIHLMYISVFLIHAVCLWCVLSFVSTTGVFFATLEYMLREGMFGVSKRVKTYLKWIHIPLLIMMYGLVFLMVFGVRHMSEIYPEFFDINWPDPAFWL